MSRTDKNNKIISMGLGPEESENIDNMEGLKKPTQQNRKLIHGPCTIRI